MATVRFSDDLRDNVLNNAKDLFANRLDTALKNFPDDWGMRVYKLIYRDHMDTMAKLPAGYLDTITKLQLTGFSSKVYPNPLGRAVGMPLPTSMPIPQRIEDNPMHGLADSGNRYNRDYKLNPFDDRWNEFKAEYTVYCERLDKLFDERDKFADSVNLIMNTYSTLAPALKAWPPLWDLIPADKQERHKEIVERKKKDIQLENVVDLNSMTAVSAMAKLTGGK
jgi:hypothetical protein